MKRTIFLHSGLLVLLLSPASAVYGQLPPDIVGMSIACSNDRVYTWYVGGNVTEGASSVLGAIRPYVPATRYSLPPGQSPRDIVGMGIAGDDHVYVWYRNGTVSSGTSTDLDRFRPPARYSLAPGKSPGDVAGIDIACSDDHVYVWYLDGTVSSGTSTDLDKFRPRSRYSLPPSQTPRELVEMGIARNDHVYAWYTDRAISSGTSTQLDRHKIEPEQVAFDDSLFLETLIRDQRDPSYGALANAAVRPLGGGAGYSRIVPHPEPVSNPGPPAATLPRTTLVRTTSELRAALRTVGPQTIYIDDGADLDLTYCAQQSRPSECVDQGSGPRVCSDYMLVVPPNTTLASGRGRNGSRGARLFSQTFTGCALLDVNANGVRITGLRIQGPDSSIENDDPIHCNGESIGIMVSSDGPLRRENEIDNNELSAWPEAAISISNVQGVRVHHNVIRFNRRQEHNGTCKSEPYGLGYGVVVGPGSVAVEANVFDHNRHDIASGGRPGSFYTATYNLVLGGAVDHSFDVHGGTDREDATNIAGSGFVIHHNTFVESDQPAVHLRGVPIRGAWVYKNETSADTEGRAFIQDLPPGRFHVTDNKTGVRRKLDGFASSSTAFKPSSLIAPLLLVQPDGLDERPVTSGIPHREPDPGLAPRVERDAVSLGAERTQVGGADDLAVDRLAVTPHDFHERQRKRPLDVGGDRALVAGAFHAVGRDQDLAGRDEEITVPERGEDRAPVLVGPRYLVELQVVHREVRIQVVFRPFLIGVDIRDHVLRA
jgi:hypothetical protein